MTKNTDKKGFTIVELLIVIVVIAILAAITIVSYTGVQNRARAVAITSGIRNIEDSLRILAVNENRSTWWPDTTFTGVNNPTIDDLIGTSDLKLSLHTSPTVPGLSFVWTYDNDGDVRDPAECLASADLGGNSWTGVVLAVGNIPDAIILSVDKTLDDGNPLCGKVRYGNSTKSYLLYQLGYNQAIE
ncbi:MAG: type II secretion system protein [Candidatus Saccharimonadaceae bacterium]